MLRVTLTLNLDVVRFSFRLFCPIISTVPASVFKASRVLWLAYRVHLAEATFCEANNNILGNQLWRLGKPTFPAFKFHWHQGCYSWRFEFNFT